MGEGQRNSVDDPNLSVSQGDFLNMFTKWQMSRALLAVILMTMMGLGFARAADVLNMGLVPAEDPSVIMNDNKILIGELEKSLQMTIKPFVATDYNGVIEALRSKKLDIALLGPFSYALATTVADVEAFARSGAGEVRPKPVPAHPAAAPPR